MLYSLLAHQWKLSIKCPPGCLLGNVIISVKQVEMQAVQDMLPQPTSILPAKQSKKRSLQIITSACFFGIFAHLPSIKRY